MVVGTFKDDERKRRAEVVLQLLRDTKPGDVLAYDRIADSIGVAWDRGRNEDFRAATGSARRRLRNEHRRTTRCVDGVGIRVATNMMVLMECAPERMRRAARQTHHGTAELGTVDATGLSDHQRKIYAARVGVMAEQRRALRREARAMERSVKSPTNPRRPSNSQ